MILLLGDIHGEFKTLWSQICRKDITDCIIIQVGDFGIGFNNQESNNNILMGLNDLLKSRNIIMYVIRGNHDDPSYFKGNHQFSNLVLLEDYSTLELEGYKFLFIGGAISIDRKQQILKNIEYAKYGSSKKSYWYDECVYLNDEKIDQIENVDILITHTAPEWCVPNNILNGVGFLVEHYAANDPTLIDELAAERKLMSDIFNRLQKKSSITKHFYGHFHKSDITLNGMCMHQLLGVHEIIELN